MPLAEPFSALGAGNGFPECLTKVHVENFPANTIWTTLSGYNSNSEGEPSEEQLNDSLMLAMRLYWNFYAVNGTASTNATWTGVGGVSTQVTNVTTEGVERSEPKERVSDRVENNISEEPDYAGQHGNNISADSEMSYTIGVREFYKNEELIGYAFAGLFRSTSSFSYNDDPDIMANAGSGSVSVSLAGSATNINNDADAPYRRQQTNFSEVAGMHFVGSCRCWYYDWGDEPTSAINFSELSASISASGFSLSSTMSSQIADLEFYEYPV